MIKTGSDFSGVGAFDQAFERLGIKQDKIFACDMDKYARQTYIYNYGEPKYYPENVYDREIPKESLGVYMTSPPCQGFSIAGKRGGSILFLNSHEFIKVNKPRYFIFENVKGLLSHEKKNKDDTYGNTFNQWLNYLGGKSVNGNPVIFPHEESVPYHIYHKVINAKKCGVPQNRERVFIVGIRDDVDNTFTWSKDLPLEKRLKDVLEDEVDEKYYLSDKMISYLINTKFKQDKQLIQNKDICDTLLSNSSTKCIKVGHINQDTQASQVFSDKGTAPNICAGTHGYANGYVKIKSATKQGFELATENDSINFSVPNSETRRGRVGKGVAQTLDTACNQGIINKDKIRRLTPLECFRLMDFNPSFKWNVSDTQAYKQAGNSIVVACLVGILDKLNLTPVDG